MTIKEIEEEENTRLWAEEASRRDADWDAKGGKGRAAADVLREARAKLK